MYIANVFIMLMMLKLTNKMKNLEIFTFQIAINKSYDHTA